MTDDAVYWRWLCHVENVMKRDIVFEGRGEQPRLPPSHIILRDAPLQSREQDQEQFRDEVTPGLIITPAGTVTRPSSAGTNKMHDVEYTVLLQIIDRHDGRFSRDQTASHLWWCQLIARALHGAALDRHEWGDGFPYIAWTEETKVVDESVYWRHEMFVRGVVAACTVREPSGLK